MRIELEKQDITDLMYDAFCNGGMNEIYYCDVHVEWNHGVNNKNYYKAKKLLKDEGREEVCMEDVFVRVFLEYGIEFFDYNFRGEENQTILLTYDLAKKNLAKAMEEPWFVKEVQKVIPEYNDADAWTGLNILQGALYGEVIYG